MAKRIEDSDDEVLQLPVVHQMAKASADERHPASEDCWCKPIDLGPDPAYGGARVLFHHVVH